MVDRNLLAKIDWLPTYLKVSITEKFDFWLYNQKTKKTFTPGLEGTDFNKNVDVGNFIREAKSLYETKGTNKSFEILFKVLYNEVPEILNLEETPLELLNFIFL